MSSFKPFHKEKYYVSGEVFEKHFYASKEVKFYKNNKELNLTKWNEEINRHFSQSLKEKNPNKLIQHIDAVRYKKLVQLIQPSKRDKIADIGSDTGKLALMIADKTNELTCVDIDKNLLENIKSKTNSPKVKFLHANLENTQIADNLFDTTIASEILEHLPNPDAGYKELLRITKPKGKIVISVPNEKMILIIKKVLRVTGLGFILGGLSTKQAIGHVRIFTPNSLKQLINKNGGKLISLCYSKPYFTNIFVVVEKDS